MCSDVPVANALTYTCTSATDSVVASCDTGFTLTDGACVADTTTTAAPDATAPAPAPVAAATAPAATAPGPASLSAATSLVQSWSSIVVAVVMLVGIFQ
jgi:hypothetical protein